MSIDDSKDIEGRLKPQKRLLSFALSRKVPPLPTQDERKPFAESNASFFKQVAFWWLNPIMHTGYKRTLEPEDMFILTEDIKVENMTQKFYLLFARYTEYAKRKHIAKKCKERGETPETSSVDPEEDLLDYQVSKFMTMFSVLDTFRWQYLTSCGFLVLANSAVTCNPLLTKKLITFVEYKVMGLEPSMGKGVGYAIGASLMVMLNGVLVNHFMYRSMSTGAKVKAVLTKAILEKSFKLSAASKHKYPTGKITSMMGTDLARVDFALGFQPFLFTFPVPIIIAIIILLVNIGPVALIGVALMAIFMICIALSTKRLFAYRSRANVFTDSRVNYIKEVLTNLKVIKFYSWEPPYQENVSETRRKEMTIIYRMQVLRNIITAFAMSLTLISSMITFLILYAVRSSNRSAADIFSSISLFNVLTQQVIMIPMALASGVDAYIGVGRVGEFLASEEENPDEMKIDASEEQKIIMEKDNTSIEVKNAFFEWEKFGNSDMESENSKNSSEFEQQEIKLSNNSDNSDKISDVNLKVENEETFKGLNDINLTVKKGEFIVITGLIGSGKSSLLAALSGTMRRTSGDLAVNGSLLLCGFPWVQNATVKENIIFGSEFDEKRYNDVVYACSLESDLEILPAGDNTEIGERGITLSGGQKARINLARAVYANKEIILLDDVLSAVDAKVGKHIMSNCVLGLLKDKTRILATHQLSLIGSADRIIFLNGNGSIDVGTFEELKLRNQNFGKLMDYSTDSKDDDEEAEKEIEEDEDEDVMEEEKEEIDRQISKIMSNDNEEAIHRDFNVNKDQDGKLFSSEERAVNGIKRAVYQSYITLGSGKFGGAMVPLIFSLMVLATFCQLFTNTWLSFWTEYKFKDKSDHFYIGFYVMFCILSFIFLVNEFVLLCYLTNRASIQLNIKSLQKILHAPMSFMDTTPMGRILNRFTKDTDVLDNEIGDQLRFLIYTFSNISGVLILCICYLPYFAIAIPFLVALFVSISSYYQASSREVKRLEAVQRSFVYNNFSEVLGGLATIRAYNHEKRFLDLNSVLIDNMNEAYYITIALQRWLAIHLDFVAFILALIVSLLCVFRVFNISAASVGLLLSYVLQIAGQLSMLIRTLTQVENEMNSVERLCQYAFELPEEAPYQTEISPPPSWPEHGGITFENASMAYRPGLPLVLKNIKLNVKSYEKIGICGRTGAGKSSIMTALYRLSELHSGKILIDGVDISQLGLKDLRTKLSIIPQDPILFRGSVRKNLDPFNEHSDEVLWDALRRSGLIEDSKLEVAKNQDKTDDNLFKFHLDQNVEDDGKNFSLGERQLISFARALVRESKILILDEATSSVDYETDAKIQATIVKEFKDCTILCIAHRLKTIINYDKILVLDKGEVREFDTPWNLFTKENSIFSQMCQKSNIVAADFPKSPF